MGNNDKLLDSLPDQHRKICSYCSNAFEGEEVCTPYALFSRFLAAEIVFYSFSMSLQL